MSITALGNKEPIGPLTWEDAAAAAMVQIFEKIDAALRYSTESAFSEELIKIQFEGMYANSQCFDSDPMYWAEEWRILGAIAAAAGFKNLAFLSIGGPAAGQEVTGKFKNFASSYPYPEFSVTSDKSKKMQNLCANILATLCRKQNDYGHENIARFGRLGLLVRVHDKIARLNNLLAKGGVPQNESIEDTYVDIVGYSAIGMMVERGWFGLQLSNQY